MTQKNTLKNTLETIIKNCYANYEISEERKKYEISEESKFMVVFTKNTINISIHPGNPHSGQNFYKLIEEIGEKVEDVLSNEGYKLEERKFIYDHYAISFKKT